MQQYRCAHCGETDKNKFYGKKKAVCGKCHNKYTLKRGQEKRKFAIDMLGGCCKLCGYNFYYGSIDIHHVDPSLKDSKFTQMRGWSKERILKEIKNCVALCRNCHGEVHAGLKTI
jgi:predicted HNH restriction endonuclease